MSPRFIEVTNDDGTRSPALVTREHDDGSINVRVFSDAGPAADTVRTHVDEDGNPYPYEDAGHDTATAGATAVYGAGGAPATAPVEPPAPPATAPVQSEGAVFDPAAQLAGTAPVADPQPTPTGQIGAPGEPGPHAGR